MSRSLVISLADSKTIEKFAILEFRHGDQERGRTIFEGLVDRYPKRLDIWNNYIDQVVRLADIQSCRCVLVMFPSISVKLSSLHAGSCFFTED
jgi:hypothetical protein